MNDQITTEAIVYARDVKPSGVTLTGVALGSLSFDNRDIMLAYVAGAARNPMPWNVQQEGGGISTLAQGEGDLTTPHQAAENISE